MIRRGDRARTMAAARRPPAVAPPASGAPLRRAARRLRARRRAPRGELVARHALERLRRGRASSGPRSVPRAPPEPPHRAGVSRVDPALPGVPPVPAPLGVVGGRCGGVPESPGRTTPGGRLDTESGARSPLVPVPVRARDGVPVARRARPGPSTPAASGRADACRGALRPRRHGRDAAHDGLAPLRRGAAPARVCPPAGQGRGPRAALPHRARGQGPPGSSGRASRGAPRAPAPAARVRARAARTGRRGGRGLGGTPPRVRAEAPLGRPIDRLAVALPRDPHLPAPGDRTDPTPPPPRDRPPARRPGRRPRSGLFTRGSPATRSGIRSRPISSRTDTTSARSRSSSATRASRRR